MQHLIVDVVYHIYIYIYQYRTQPLGAVQEVKDQHCNTL